MSLSLNCRFSTYFMLLFLYVYAGADFSKDYPYSFSMNLGTAPNNNVDSLLTPEYGHNQLLSSTHTYSPQLLQQPQSDSTTLDMSVPSID